MAEISGVVLPVYDIKDFSKLSIPFKCIATDVGTGKAVVLDQGEIVTAIRSSMAIPSIFTAIDYKDTKLVDGGVVRNFPVRDVMDMGANYTIGENYRMLAQQNQTFGKQDNNNLILSFYHERFKLPI